MYALNVGVRNKFFSLSCLSETPDQALEKSQEVIEGWCSSYNLDPSWDQGMNGQGNDSLVWCRDGAKILTPKHFQDGFFMILVKESKDSEIKLWKPVQGSVRILCAELRKFGYSHGLRLVKPFGPSTSEQMRRVLRKSGRLAFTESHLEKWTEELVNSDSGYSSRLFAWPESRLLPGRQSDCTVN